MRAGQFPTAYVLRYDEDAPATATVAHSRRERDDGFETLALQAGISYQDCHMIMILAETPLFRTRITT